MTRLSIVIPTHDRPSDLERCLAALRAQAADTRAETVVVDDASSSACIARNRAVCATNRATYVFNNGAPGPAASRNLGAARTTGDWIAFLDDDVTVGEGWIDTAIERTAGASDAVVGIEGRVDVSGDGLWDTEVQNLSGGLYLSCNIAYRRAAFKKTGRFDEHFHGPFCEDQELAGRMLSSGTIVFEPAMKVTHGRRSANPWHILRRAPGRIRMLLESEIYFFVKDPASYSRFRSCPDFWGTYRSIISRHAYICMKRRRAGSLARHPFQAAILLIASVVEQAYTIGLGFRLTRGYQSLAAGKQT